MFYIQLLHFRVFSLFLYAIDYLAKLVVRHPLAYVEIILELGWQILREGNEKSILDQSLIAYWYLLREETGLDYF